MESSQYKQSQLHKAFLKMAVECTALLRTASDAGIPLTPFLIGQIQDSIVKAIGNAYFGVLPMGWDEWGQS